MQAQLFEEKNLFSHLYSIFTADLFTFFLSLLPFYLEAENLIALLTVCKYLIVSH